MEKLNSNISKLTTKTKKKKEFSKKILIQIKWLFIIQIILLIIFMCLGYDTTALQSTTAVSGGVLGACVIFYLNKAKVENVSKGRLKLAIFKTKLNGKDFTQEDINNLNEEIDKIDMQYDMCVDNTLSNALNEEISMQSYQ